MPRLNAKEQAIRNTQLVSTKLANPTIMWKDLGAMYGLSINQARRVWQSYRDDLKSYFVEDTTDYLAVVADKIKHFEEIRSELHKAAAQAAKYNQTAARVGALKAIVDVHREELTLLQKTGLLPNDLGVIRVQMDVRAVSTAFIAIFHKFVPAEVAREAERELLDVLRPNLSRQALAGTVGAGDDSVPLIDE